MPEVANPLKVIDITTVNQETAELLLHEAATQGFLFIEGHDFSQEEVDELFKMSAGFFAKPAEYKSQWKINESNTGYTRYGGENLDPSTQEKGDPKEAFNFSRLRFKDESTTDDESPLPDFFTEDADRKKLIDKSTRKLYDITIILLRLLAMGLKIEDTTDEQGNVVPGSEYFTIRHPSDIPTGNTLRLLHYPGQTALRPEAVIRAGAHTDYGGMTLLFQKEHQEGLEIFSPKSKSWEAVPFVSSSKAGKAPPIIVNMADQLSYWTNGLLKSTIHRVKFPAKVQETGQDRYSIVFFNHPNDDCLLEPVPSPLTRDIKGRGASAEKGKIPTAKEHLDKRLYVSYGQFNNGY